MSANTPIAVENKEELGDASWCLLGEDGRWDDPEMAFFKWWPTAATM
jgi:hypothetical protein